MLKSLFAPQKICVIHQTIILRSIRTTIYLHIYFNHHTQMDEIIPRDMWLLIASFLEDKSKRQLRLVNTKLFNIIKYNNFNIYFTRKEDVPAITERLSKYSWPIKLTFSKSKFNDLLDVIDHLPKLTNLIELTNDQDLKTEHVTLEQWMQLSVLTNLQVWGVPKSPAELDTKFANLTTRRSYGETEETVALKLKQLSNLKNLSYGGGSNTWPFALVPNPEKIEYLSVRAQTMVHGADAWSRLTNLVQFYFENKSTFQNEIKLEYLTSLKIFSIEGLGTVPSLAANTKLEELFLWSCETLPSLAANTNLKELYLNCENWSLPNSEMLAKLVKLKRLVLYIPTADDPQLFQFLAHLTQLETLVVNDHYNRGVNEDLYGYIPPQLHDLTFSGDIAKITHLTNLDSLFIHSTNAKHLATLSNITHLIISAATDEDDLCSIGDLTRLQALKLPYQSDERKQPDLSPLKQLTSLSYFNSPISKQTQLKHLTNLQSLHFRKPPQAGLDNCDSFAELTNLTHLGIDCAVFNMDSLWQNLAKLTNIRVLEILEVDRDDRLLLLTSCTNLRRFRICNKNKQFTGNHFTALTCLQQITFKCDNAAVAHKKEDIMKCMPYLLSYSTS